METTVWKLAKGASCLFLRKIIDFLCAELKYKCYGTPRTCLHPQYSMCNASVNHSDHTMSSPSSGTEGSPYVKPYGSNSRERALVYWLLVGNSGVDPFSDMSPIMQYVAYSFIPY